MKKEWRPVRDFPLYKVSNYGEIWSIRNGRLMRQMPRRSHFERRCAGEGHLAVSLSNENGAKRLYVHRIVAEAFLGPCPPGLEVKHLDNTPTNNRLDNLAYGTHYENMQQRRAFKTAFKPERKLTENDVSEIRRRAQIGESHTQLAGSFHVTRSCISQIVRGDRHARTWKRDQAANT